MNVTLKTALMFPFAFVWNLFLLPVNVWNAVWIQLAVNQYIKENPDEFDTDPD